VTPYSTYSQLSCIYRYLTLHLQSTDTPCRGDMPLNTVSHFMNKKTAYALGYHSNHKKTEKIVGKEQNFTQYNIIETYHNLY
jgi:hypothetical protein